MNLNERRNKMKQGKEDLSRESGFNTYYSGANKDRAKEKDKVMRATSKSKNENNKSRDRKNWNSKPISRDIHEPMINDKCGRIEDDKPIQLNKWSKRKNSDEDKSNSPQMTHESRVSRKNNPYINENEPYRDPFSKYTINLEEHPDYKLQKFKETQNLPEIDFEAQAKIEEDENRIKNSFADLSTDHLVLLRKSIISGNSNVLAETFKSSKNKIDKSGKTSNYQGGDLNNIYGQIEKFKDTSGFLREIEDLIHTYSKKSEFNATEKIENNTLSNSNKTMSINQHKSEEKFASKPFVIKGSNSNLRVQSNYMSQDKQINDKKKTNSSVNNDQNDQTESFNEKMDFSKKNNVKKVVDEENSAPPLFFSPEKNKKKELGFESNVDFEFKSQIINEDDSFNKKHSNNNTKDELNLDFVTDDDFEINDKLGIEKNDVQEKGDFSSKKKALNIKPVPQINDRLEKPSINKNKELDIFSSGLDFGMNTGVEHQIILRIFSSIRASQEVGITEIKIYDKNGSEIPLQSQNINIRGVNNEMFKKITNGKIYTIDPSDMLKIEFPMLANFVDMKINYTGPEVAALRIWNYNANPMLGCKRVEMLVGDWSAVQQELNPAPKETNKLYHQDIKINKNVVLPEVPQPPELGEKAKTSNKLASSQVYQDLFSSDNEEISNVKEMSSKKVTKKKRESKVVINFKKSNQDLVLGDSLFQGTNNQGTKQDSDSNENEYTEKTNEETVISRRQGGGKNPSNGDKAISSTLPSKHHSDHNVKVSKESKNDYFQQVKENLKRQQKENDDSDDNNNCDNQRQRDKIHVNDVEAPRRRDEISNRGNFAKDKGIKKKEISQQAEVNFINPESSQLLMLQESLYIEPKHEPSRRDNFGNNYKGNNLGDFDILETLNDHLDYLKKFNNQKTYSRIEMSNIDNMLMPESPQLKKIQESYHEFGEENFEASFTDLLKKNRKF